MTLNNLEKKLLKQQAEAYAFIYDMRQMAQYLGARGLVILERTEGIEEVIAKRRKEYPVLFQRYFNAALKKACDSSNNRMEKNTDGTGKKIPRRQKKTPKKEVKVKNRVCTNLLKELE